VKLYSELTSLIVSLAKQTAAIIGCVKSAEKSLLSLPTPTLHMIALQIVVVGQFSALSMISCIRAQKSRLIMNKPKLTAAQIAVLNAMKNGSRLFRRGLQLHGLMFQDDPANPKRVLAQRVAERTIEALISANLIKEGKRQISQQELILNEQTS
jgi:hypothetical protein